MVSKLLLPRYIARRGLHSESAAENSLTAIKLAAEQGIAVQIDVRFTADKRLVVFSDETTGRMCKTDVRLSELTYEQLGFLHLAGGEGIPSLRQVLRAVDGRVPLFIELKKCPHVSDAEKRLAHLMKKYEGEFAVQSDDPLSLRRLREAAPWIMRGQVLSDYGKKSPSAASSRAVMSLISKPDYLACDLRSITLETVFRSAELSIPLTVWTVDSEELLATAFEFCNSVMFEKISIA